MSEQKTTPEPICENPAGAAADASSPAGGPACEEAGSVLLQEQPGQLVELQSGQEPRQMQHIERANLALPAIGVLAILVANVTFLGWATPPGGDSPYWSGCNYRLYTGFLVTNGLAFVLAVMAAFLVTWTPLFMRDAHRYWESVQAAGFFLLLALAAFLVAFFLSGFVAINYQAPRPDCATTSCDQGGIKCTTTIFVDPKQLEQPNLHSFVLDINVAILNNLVTNDRSKVLCYYYANQTGSIAIPTDARPDDIPKLLDPRWGWQRLTVCLALESYLEDPHNASLMVGNDAIASVKADTNKTLASFVDSEYSEMYVSYSDLRYGCFYTKSTYNTLCEVESSVSRAVSADGQYMTISTVSSFGGTIFAQSSTATQVARWLIGISALGCSSFLTLFGALVGPRLHKFLSLCRAS